MDQLAAGRRGTERLAEAESRSRSTGSAVLIASAVSLAAVVEALIRFSGSQDAIAVAAVICSVVAVIRPRKRLRFAGRRVRTTP
jgi:hypothetical protein